MAENSKKAPRGKPFMKGQSGNPGGRPRLPEDIKHIRELARQYTGPALEALATALEQGSDAAKVAAAKELLDRGWGKSAQPLTGEGGEGPVAHAVTVLEVRGVRAPNRN